MTKKLQKETKEINSSEKTREKNEEILSKSHLLPGGCCLPLSIEKVFGMSSIYDLPLTSKWDPPMWEASHICRTYMILFPFYQTTPPFY
jgi:hypothetical protein